jgi:hypothetical protein
MQVYIVVEHPDGWGGVPHDMSEIVIGVFSSRDAATKCMEANMRYFYSFEGRELMRVDDKAVDEHGVYFFEIITRTLDAGGYAEIFAQ